MAQPVEGSSEDIQQDYAKNTATAAEIQKGVAQGIIKPTPTQEQQQEHGQYTTITPGKPVELPFGLTVSTQKPITGCLLYTSPSPRDRTRSRMPSSA